jgi:hypothetical protein
MTTTQLAAIETIRQRWLFIEVGLGAPPSAGELVADAVDKIDGIADKILARQTWAPGTPEHGNPYGRPLAPGEFTFGADVFSCAHEMARAWRCPFSKHSQKPEILERIIACLRFGEPQVRPEVPRDGSWHAWDLAFPSHITAALLLVGDQMPADLRQRLLADLEHMPSKIFTLDYKRGITRPPLSSGSNDQSVLYIGMLRGVYLNDPQWLDTVLTQVPVAMGRASGSEGLQADWSYHFHGHGINAGYGVNSLYVQGRWIYLTQGTPWQVPDSVQQLHNGMFREFFARNNWRGKGSPYTLDRGIATPRSIYGGGVFVAAMFGLATDLAPQDKAVFAAAVVDYLSALDPEGQPVRLDREMTATLLLDRLPKPIQADLSVLGGIRYYPDSQYLLVREPKWFAAVRMSSGRTTSWKGMLGYHIHGSSGAEFSIAYMTDGREFDHVTIPTMNWKRLMGVTRCDAIEPPPEGYGQSTFCSGLAGDEFAVLGLQYLLAPAGQDTLRGNKSLFVTPEAMILLGTQIRCTSPEPVVTTLFHAPLINDGPYLHNNAPLDLQKDGVWDIKAGETLYLRNTGLRLLCDAQLIVETRRGSYCDLNMPQVWEGEAQTKPGFKTVQERRWVHVVVNHGARPRQARYAALIYPLAAPDQLPAADAYKIFQEEKHHRVDLANGKIGGEVRFPGDWRKPIGSSYWGAEQHQWGSIARWLPGDDADHAQLEITAPRRFIRAEQSSTEIFLPEGFEQENVTLRTYAGTAFPANLMSLSASGKVHKLRVKRVLQK